MNTRAWRLLGVAALTLLVAGGCGKKSHMAGNRYCNPANGFSIELPPEWERREGFMGSVVCATRPQDGAAGGFRENVNVVVEKLPGSTGLKQYHEQGLKDLAGFSVSESGDATPGGVPAKWVLYARRAGPLDLEVLVYFLVREGRGYVITCTATKDAMPQHRKRFEEIVGTFKAE